MKILPLHSPKIPNMLTVILFLISLPLQIGMVNTKNVFEETEDGFCARSSLEDNEDSNTCQQGIKWLDINYELVDKLKKQNANDIFEFLDKNEDGWLDQEEFLHLISGGDISLISPRTSVQIKNIFFLLGKLSDESIDMEEFKIFLENGIKVMEPKDFHRFCLRHLSRNFISSFNGSNLTVILGKFDIDKNEVLGQREQFDAAKTIFGFPREDISWQDVSNSLEKLSKIRTDLQYLEHSTALQWTNSLIYHALNAHYESYYNDMLLRSDTNEDGYLTLVEISRSLSLFLGCIENRPICEHIFSDEMNLMQLCHADDILELRKLEVGINWAAFTPRNCDLFTKTHEEFWKLADTDSNGYITSEEQELLKTLFDTENDNGSTAETGIGEFQAKIDGNNDKIITIHELHLYFESPNWKNDRSSSKYEKLLRKLGNDDNLRNKIPTHIYQIFKIFDEDLNGKINFKELRLTREIQNFYLRTKWIDSIIKHIDEDADGVISFKEFKKLNSFRKFILPSDVCPDGKTNENYQKIFNKIDLSTDGYISKNELFEMVNLIVIADTNNDERGQDDISDYLLYAIEEIAEDSCSLIWHEFLEVAKQHGNEKVNFVDAEKDFLRWDTNEDKWINFTEYTELFKEYMHWSFDAAAFVDWLKVWLLGIGNPDYYTEEFLEDFKKQDENNDGIISKGEIIKILQNHRKNYYTEERVNAKFSRSDRNEDRYISMSEYYLLTLLKARRQQ